MDFMSVGPVCKALALAQERFETAASVFGDVAVHDGFGVEVVDVAGYLLELLEGVAWTDGGPC